MIMQNERSLLKMYNCKHYSGTEELAHLEIVGAIVHQLTRNLTIQQIKDMGFGDYYTDHGVGVYPQSSAGTPWSAATIAVKGDVLADLNEDLAAEQKARATYENILKLADDPDVIDPIKYLRAREIVHYQRFGEVLNNVYEKMDEKNMFCMGIKKK